MKLRIILTFCEFENIQLLIQTNLCIGFIAGFISGQIESCGIGLSPLHTYVFKDVSFVLHVRSNCLRYGSPLL